MNRLVVLSADALTDADMIYLKELPNFKKYLSGGAMVEEVRSIYPSLTYPCHVAMSTGAYPEKTGVFHNLKFMPGLKTPDWNWFHSAVKTTDIFTAAKRGGYTTASVFWPVTGMHPDIDYLVAEYWTQGNDETKQQAFLRTGTSPELMHDVVDKHLEGLEERRHPSCDRFVVETACDIIKSYRPNVLFLHPANIDAYKHENGIHAKRVTEGVEETDAFIGMLGLAMEESRTLEETNFVLCSDHGQLNIGRLINLNTALKRRGFYKVNDGNLIDWRAYAATNGHSAYVYLNDADKTLYNEVRTALSDMQQDPFYGIERVYEKQELLSSERLDGTFTFMLESDGITAFSDRFDSDELEETPKGYYATHGHHPDKGAQPVFYAKGPAFKNGATLKTCSLIDEAPTYAKILGVELPNAQGRVMHELLNKH